MLNNIRITGHSNVFNEHDEPENFFTALNLTYGDYIESEEADDEIYDGYSEVDLVNVNATLVNISEMINQGALRWDIFDAIDGDLLELFINFIGDKKEQEKEFCIWKPFLDHGEYSGNIIYITSVKKMNGATNVHIQEAIDDVVKRFSHCEGITTFYKGDDEQELYDVLRHMGFEVNPLDNKWIYYINNKKYNNPKIKLIK